MSIQVGHIPALTWNRLKVNSAEVTGDLTGGSAVRTRFQRLPDGISHSQISRAAAKEWLLCHAPSEPAEAVVAGKTPVYHPQSFGTGLGAQYDTVLEEAGFPVQLLEVAPGTKASDPVLWSIEYPDKTSSVQEQIVHVGEDAEVILILSCHSGAWAAGTALISTKIVLEPRARLHLVKTQMLGDGFLFLDDTGAALREEAELSMTQVELGGEKAYIGVQPELIGDRSSFDIKLYYLGMEERLYDFNYNVVHRGRRTKSRLSFDGVLGDRCEKTLRDTIDFRRGSAGSKGREEEDVLVLSDAIVNRSMPIILCEEEDVEGSHGATIGRMDEEVLFYLASRGIDQDEAIRMMVRARLSSIAGDIPDKTLRAELMARAEEEFGE